MKATITKTGALKIEVESETEAYAFQTWLENHMDVCKHAEGKAAVRFDGIELVENYESLMKTA